MIEWFGGKHKYPLSFSLFDDEKLNKLYQTIQNDHEAHIITNNEIDVIFTNWYETHTHYHAGAKNYDPEDLMKKRHLIDKVKGKTYQEAIDYLNDLGIKTLSIVILVKWIQGCASRDLSNWRKLDPVIYLDTYNKIYQK
jgi:thermostable 8-oxoguanine DNA glycosylase